MAGTSVMGSAVDPDLQKWRTELADWRRDWGGAGKEYRARLQTACKFLSKVRGSSGGGGRTETQILRIKRTLTEESAAQRDEHLTFLIYLRLALQHLERWKNEKIQPYTERLRDTEAELAGPPMQNVWEATRVLLFSPPESPATEPDTFRQRLNFLSRLAELEERLDALQNASGQDRQIWKDCFDDCVVDWEWAYLQVSVALALEYLRRLEERPARLERRDWAERAEKLLAEVIEKLEEKDFLQARTQGLYGLLARACLARATISDIPAREALELLRRALTYARSAVEMEPESARERLVLLQIYGILGDDGQVKSEAEIALNLDPGPETLKAIGAGFRARLDAASRRVERRKVLREAVAFFERALRLVESETGDDQRPLAQMQRHAWAHYWLGRFHCELMEYEKGIAHERIGTLLGFKPLESRVNLAWAYFEAKAYDQAERAFRDAETEADKQRPAGHHAEVADAPGEEEPIDELLIDIHLGRAFLYAERNVKLEAAEESARKAEGLISLLKDPSHQRQQHAAFHECLGRIHYRRGKLDASDKEARKAIESSARSGAYCCLLYTHLAKARKDPKHWAKVARECDELWMRARETDIRQRNRAEILDIRRQMRGLEESQKPKVPPSAKPEPQAAADKAKKTV
jgi:tetratricopeptide (TPR) repeat protein